MNKLLASIFVLSLAVVFQTVMILGWGLRQVNWWWIVGGVVFGMTGLRMVAIRVDKV